MTKWPQLQDAAGGFASLAASVAKSARAIDRVYRPRGAAGDEIPPPSSMTVYDDKRTVIFTHDEKPLIRRVGF